MRRHYSLALLALMLLCAAPIHQPEARLSAAEAPTPRTRAEVRAVLDQAPAEPGEDGLKELNVVLWADVKDHGPGAHDYPCWQKRWAVLLGGKGAGGSDAQQVNLHGPARDDDGQALAGAPKVNVETAWKWPGNNLVESADLMVMFCYRSGGESRSWPDLRIKRLKRYVSQGGGLVVVHSATFTERNLAEPKHADVAGLTGLAFDRATILVRHGPMDLKITAADHPICLGLPSTIGLVDEPYWPPIGNLGDVTVLATSDESDKDRAGTPEPQAMFWTCEYGKGRVFACVPGHFNWTFDDPYFRILLLRGMAWAAGESPYRLDRLVTRGAAMQE
jgi:type 1 glutamine amidotransferase